MRRLRAIPLLLGAALFIPSAASIARASEPATLAVQDGDAWHAFWRSDRAPSRFSTADPSVTEALRWKRLAPGLEWSELRIACAAPVWRAKLIVARIDPRETGLTLAMDLTRDDMRPAWTIDRAPEDAILAVNVAQFASAMPWGWVVIDGRQRLAPGAGPARDRRGHRPRRRRSLGAWRHTRDSRNRHGIPVLPDPSLTRWDRSRSATNGRQSGQSHASRTRASRSAKRVMGTS
jgi:hypothetical protein